MICTPWQTRYVDDANGYVIFDNEGQALAVGLMQQEANAIVTTMNARFPDDNNKNVKGKAWCYNYTTVEGIKPAPYR